MSKDDIQLENHRVRLNEVEKKIDTILGNHLPHLQTGIDDLKISQAKWSGGMAVGLAILQIILKFM